MSKKKVVLYFEKKDFERLQNQYNTQIESEYGRVIFRITTASTFQAFLKELITIGSDFKDRSLAEYEKQNENQDSN